MSMSRKVYFGRRCTMASLFMAPWVILTRSERRRDLMASERPRRPRRGYRTMFQAVYVGTIWVPRRRGRYLYVFVRDVRDMAGDAVCALGIVRQTDALQALALRPGDAFTFEARYVRGAEDTHEFRDVAHVRPGGAM